MPNDTFLEYAEAHGERALTPLVVMASKGLGRTLGVWRLFGTIRILLDLRRYLAGPALSDDPEVREARVRATYEKVLMDSDLPADAMRPVVDYFVEKVLSELVATVDREVVGNDGSKS